MAKELIARYYGERNAISVPTTLKPEYARKLADANFLQYLATIPYNVLLNTSDFNWMFLKTMRVRVMRWRGHEGMGMGMGSMDAAVCPVRDVAACSPLLAIAWHYTTHMAVSKLSAPKLSPFQPCRSSAGQECRWSSAW